MCKIKLNYILYVFCSFVLYLLINYVILCLCCGFISYLVVIRVNGDLLWNVVYILGLNVGGWMESNLG